jgi:exonuclease VII small subunit
MAIGDEESANGAGRTPASAGSPAGLEDDPLERLKKRVFKRINRLGIPGLIVFLIFLAWLKWDEVKKIPGVGWVAESISELVPLPQATGNRFAIAIVRLENDKDGAHQRLIREALSEHREIELLDLPRMISVEGSMKPQDAIRAGHERARALLKQSHADVMIWGSALDSDIKAPLVLHWTMSTEVAPRKSQGKYRPDDAHDLDLPELFWADMNDVLGMLVTAEEAKVSTQEGHAIADQLKPFIERIHYLLQSPKLSSEKKAPLWGALGDSFELYGEQLGDSPKLEQAVTAYQEALKEYARERVPLQWAKTENNLGSALAVLGERESGTAHLEQAVTAYQEALKENTREHVPLDWAMTQTNLGSALAVLGERESGTARLEQAVSAFQEALKERTRERVPLEWAMTQSNLGAALSSLGERESGTARLEQAVAAY